MYRFYLTDKERCRIIDCGAFNDIITGYIALAFDMAGVKVYALNIANRVLDENSANRALSRFQEF